MPTLDDILNSNPFWGTVALFFLIIGGVWKDDTVKALALLVGWGVGVYRFYGFWSSQTAQDWRLLGGGVLVYTGLILLLFFSVDAHRPVSRLINGEPVGRGKFITGVSHLNVGALPSSGAPIPNPPDWHKPTAMMNLLFQDSPLLTSAVQEQITEDLSAFREYLVNLDLPVPEKYPPIGISNDPGSSLSRTWGSLPTYRSGAKINQGFVLDRRAVTEQYVHFVIGEMLRTTQHPSLSSTQEMVATSATAEYYNWSFWDYKADNAGGYWSTQLWEIRKAMGKQFADRLVGSTLKSILDNPEEGADPDFDFYFYRKIQVADSIIDNNGQKMGEITAIIEGLGINVTKPRAVLEFMSTAVKRRDGSLVVNVTVNNKTDVPTGKGQIRLYFAPDARFLREPAGAQRDPLTTLESSRVFPFDSIAAKATSRIRLELKPKSSSFEIDPIIHFDYTCEGCARDSYSHDLRFKMKNS